MDSFLHRLLRKFLWARRTYGLGGAVRICRLHLVEIFSRFGPAGRRRRERELEFDRERGVDTGGTVSLFHLTIESPNVRSGLRYQATVPEQFRLIVGSLPISPSEFVFVDLGSGKGRAIILAAEYPFKRVVGVEFSPQLHAIAEKNLALCDRAYVRCGVSESVCQDVVEYEFPVEPLVVYLYNPFLPDIVRRVVQKLEKSIEEHPRTVYVIYVNPLAKGVLEASRGFVLHASGHGWCVYVSVRGRA